MITIFIYKEKCQRIKTMESCQKIKFYRKKRNMTQDELAEAANLSTSYISQVETGRKNIGREGLEKIAEAYYTDPPETIPNIPDYFFIYTFYFYVHFPSKSISFRWILGDYDTYDSIINRICKGGVIVKSLLEAVCSLCLASSAMMHWEGCSILFFGEYPFPEK
jgi:transcriptional regulator with XRE-family HTH domain